MNATNRNEIKADMKSAANKAAYSPLMEALARLG